MALEIRFAFGRGLFVDRLHDVRKFSLLAKQAYEHLETRQELRKTEKDFKESQHSCLYALTLLLG